MRTCPEEIGNGVVTLEVDALTLPARPVRRCCAGRRLWTGGAERRAMLPRAADKRRRTHAGAAAYAKWALFAAKCCLQDITWKEETYHVLDR